MLAVTTTAHNVHTIVAVAYALWNLLYTATQDVNCTFRFDVQYVVYT
jgi:hypothetical protein